MSGASNAPEGKYRVSLVIPLHNESENVGPLIQAIANVRREDWEAVFIDDGSTDDTLSKLRFLGGQHQWIRIVVLQQKSGQAAAIFAGVQHAKSDLLVTLDGDLQNDPADIQKIVAELDAGNDFVIGRRVKRQDTAITRKIPSFIANRLITWSLGVPFRDIGCGLRGYRREVVDRLWWFGEMHRYASILAHLQGFRTKEIDVSHHPRTAGTAKYGLGRIPRIVRDLTMLLSLTGRAWALSGVLAPLCLLSLLISLFWANRSPDGLPTWFGLLTALLCGSTVLWLWFVNYVSGFYMTRFGRSRWKPWYEVKEVVEQP